LHMFAFLVTFVVQVNIASYIIISIIVYCSYRA